MSDSEAIRLNKFISETGVCSRREADRLIEDGSVQVNGRRAEMGMRVSASDRVTVRGKPLRSKPPAVYLAYHKPVGITCTTDPQVAGNIVEAVRYRGRIFPIGRLDKPSEGLILLTNDGDIVNKILRAGNAHEKEYLVSVDRPIDSEFLQRMAAGVPILETVTQPCRIRQTAAASFNIVLTQGLNRQIRRMTEFLGYNVTRLKRVRVMNIALGSLPVGQWRELSAPELDRVGQMIASSSKTEEASGEPKAAASLSGRAKSDSAKRTDQRPQPGGGKKPPGKPRRPGHAKGSKPRAANAGATKVGPGGPGPRRGGRSGKSGRVGKA